MIRPLPTSLAGRLLVLLVDRPGELDVSGLARVLFPPPTMTTPPTSIEGWRVWATAKQAHVRTSAHRVSRALGKLQERGLVAPCAAPVVSTWFRADIERHGLLVALERAHPSWPGKVPRLDLHAALVARGDKLPRTVAGVVGPSPTGATWRAWADLVAMGVYVPPGFRSPTPRAVSLVLSWRGVRRVRGEWHRWAA